MLYTFVFAIARVHFSEICVDFYQERNIIARVLFFFFVKSSQL